MASAWDGISRSATVESSWESMPMQRWADSWFGTVLDVDDEVGAEGADGEDVGRAGEGAVR
jgi:hypothetical protein